MTDIDDKFAQLKAAGLDFGSTQTEGLCADRVGRYRHCVDGSIFSHPSTGASGVAGAVRDHWRSLGCEESWLGYPVADAVHVWGVSFSRFQNGWIRQLPFIGVQDVTQVQAESYWAQSEASHALKVMAFRSRGMRMVSLAIDRSLASVTYAAVWVVSETLDWNEIHGVDEKTLGTWVNAEAALGRHLDLISASGTGSERVFAAATVAGEPALAWAPRLTPDSLRTWSVRARRNGAMLTSLSLYEQNGTSWAAAVFRRNRQQMPWSDATTPLGPQEDMARFHVHAAHHGTPEFTAVSAQHWASLYIDAEVGPWASFAGLTRSSFEAKVAEHTAQGFFPRRIDVAGGSDPRFSVVFRKTLSPLPRRLVSTGESVPELSVLDEQVTAYMQRSGIRAASMAVAKDDRLIYARAFTWSAPGYPVAQPTTNFRIGSESKVLTAIMIRQLMEEPSALGRSGANPMPLLPDHTVSEVLNLEPVRSRPTTDGFDQITIEELIKHRTALPHDFAHLDAQVVALFGRSLPARSKREFVRYIMGEPMSLPAGGYRNTNYLVLGAVVEHVTGTTWVSALRERILRPLGLTRPSQSRSTLARSRENEILCHDANLELAQSVMHGGHPPLVRSGYGNVNLEEVGDAIGGMAFAQCDLVRVLSSLGPNSPHTLLSHYKPADVMHTGSTTPGSPGSRTRPAIPGITSWFHGGLSSSAHAEMATRSDGISWAVAFNGPPSGHELQPDYDAMIDAVAERLPTHDLYSHVGLAPPT